MLILESPVLLFMVTVILLMFVINPAIGWFVCGVADYYNGKNGYGKYACVGFVLMFMVMMLYLIATMILTLTGTPVPPFQG